MKGRDCSSGSTAPEHRPNPDGPLFRAINLGSGTGGGDAEGGRRDEDERKETRTDVQEVLGCKFNLH